MITFLVISFSVGTQLVFSPQKVNKGIHKVLERLKNKGFNKEDIKITFDKAQTTVVGSLSHPFGVRIKNLKIELNKECKKYEARFESLVVPFNLSKALKEEVDLGLVRLNGGEFVESNTCESLESKNYLGAKNYKKQFEKKWINFFKKASEIDLSSFKEKSRDGLEGVLVYDFKIMLNDSDKDFLKIDRLKTLFGSGVVLARSDLSATLNFQNGQTSIEGYAEAYKDRLSIDLDLKEKEGLVKVTSVVHKAIDEASFYATTNLTVSHLPLSIVSRFKKLKLVGLDLRKTWLSFDAEIKTNKNALGCEFRKFKTTGEFGSLVLSSDELVAKWSVLNPLWVQKDPVEIKLNEISIGDVVAVKSRKKVKGVFGEFGKFSAFLRLTDLRRLEGDFETKDFSILFRSMGKSAYQKAKSATGHIDYTVDEALSFSLNTVEFVDGDFEGLINLEYNFDTKKIETDFNVSHFKLKSSIFKDLFNFEILDGFEINGTGWMSKNMFIEQNNPETKKSGKVLFKLKTKEVKFKNWVMSGFESECDLNESLLNCDLRSKDIVFSKLFSEAAKIEKTIYKKLKSKDFSFKSGELKFSFVSSEKEVFEFKWGKEKGLFIDPIKPGASSVKLRELDQ